jgi:ribonuclease Y
MTEELAIPLQALTLLLGVFLGLGLMRIYHSLKVGNYTNLGNGIIKEAELQAKMLKNNAELAIKQKQAESQWDLENLRQAWRREQLREEERIKQKEDKLESRMHLVEKKLSDIEKREAVIIARKEQLELEKKEIAASQAKLTGELEKISGLSSTQAKDILINQLTGEIQADAANLTRRIIREAEEEAETQAAKILATAIQRIAVSCASETTVCTVGIPKEEMKGRIIGRDGRNIRAIEEATGVNIIIDETPGAVVLSGYDPVRRQIAKAALTELIADGRIHPTRIEEVVPKATLAVQKQIKQYGEDAAIRAGVMNLHPELINLLGKLKFRYSYGQNVLDHSLEVSHIMGLLAAELNLDIRLAKRIGLLHDMGKAIMHEMEGSHAIVGRDLSLKYGESKEVANGIGCHHNEIEPITVEASLCSTADAISASRPGARIEAVEEYIKRLTDLENIASKFPGVEKVYAMQAGRELRVVVLPNMIDDDGLVNLSRDLVKKIEQEICYSKRIKVTLVREKRIIVST